MEGENRIISKALILDLKQIKETEKLSPEITKLYDFVLNFGKMREDVFRLITDTRIYQMRLSDTVLRTITKFISDYAATEWVNLCLMINFNEKNDIVQEIMTDYIRKAYEKGCEVSSIKDAIECAAVPAEFVESINKLISQKQESDSFEEIEKNLKNVNESISRQGTNDNQQDFSEIAGILSSQIIEALEKRIGTASADSSLEVKSQDVDTETEKSESQDNKESHVEENLNESASESTSESDLAGSDEVEAEKDTKQEINDIKIDRHADFSDAVKLDVDEKKKIAEKQNDEKMLGFLGALRYRKRLKRFKKETKEKQKLDVFALLQSRSGTNYDVSAITTIAKCVQAGASWEFVYAAIEKGSNKDDFEKLFLFLTTGKKEGDNGYAETENQSIPGNA